MKIKTSELNHGALNWAVEKCEQNHPTGYIPRVNPDGTTTRMILWYKPYATDWAYGGPIIEREKINLYHECGMWQAVIYDAHGYFDLLNGIGYSAFAPTPLLASMRCYVASKLGDEIDVPDELLGE